MASLPGALALALLAGAHIGGEWSGRTMKNLLAQQGRRWRVLAAKLGAPHGLAELAEVEGRPQALRENLGGIIAHDAIVMRFPAALSRALIAVALRPGGPCHQA